MKRLLILAIMSLCMTSCGVTASLYYWGGTHNGFTEYDHLAYKHTDKQTPEYICKLICMYEDMVSNPGGTRMVVPPGICAEYGYMLLNPDNAQIFAEHATGAQKKMFRSSDYAALFPELGKEMLLKEIELYPESAKFLEPLIERLCK